MAGGAVEAGGAAVSPEAGPAAMLVYVHGVDEIRTGWYMLITGERHRTATSQAISGTLVFVGTDEATAAQFGDLTEAGVSILLQPGSIGRLQSVRRSNSILDGLATRRVRVGVDSFLREGGRRGGFILDPDDIIVIRQQLSDEGIYLSWGADKYIASRSAPGAMGYALHRYFHGHNIIYLRRTAELDDFIHEYMHALDALQYQNRYLRMSEPWREYANFYRLRRSQYWDMMSPEAQRAALENLRNFGPWKKLPDWIESSDLTSYLDPWTLF